MSLSLRVGGSSWRYPGRGPAYALHVRGKAPTVRAPARIGVVVATRDRRETLLATLPRLLRAPERPPVVVVDNGSSDGTADAVRSAFPEITVIRSEVNLGAGARTLGVRRLDTEYVAFADDDSWWAPGGLGRAVELLARHERVGLVAARVLVGDDERLDPVCAAM